MRRGLPRVADDPRVEYLLVAGKGEIVKIRQSPVGHDLQQALPLSGLRNVVALDYHWASRTLFYSDEAADVIARVSLDGHDRRGHALPIHQYG